jgi:hypothetical protein
MEHQTGTPATMATMIAMNALLDIRPVLATVTVPTLVVHRVGEALLHRAVAPVSGSSRGAV